MRARCWSLRCAHDDLRADGSRSGGVVHANRTTGILPAIKRWRAECRRHVFLVAALLAFAGCATAPRTRVDLSTIPIEQRERAEHNLRVFRAVWDLVNRKHYDPEFHGIDWEAAAATFGPQAAAAPDDDALYRVLNAMLEPLDDSHTHALTPAHVVERRTRQRARTGFDMIRLESRWVVVDVMPGSPAEKVGVKTGWIVVARNGQPLEGRLDFRPQEGEEVAWDFLDEHDRPVRLSPVATRLSIGPQRIVRELDGGFVYLRFDEFDGPSRRWVREKMREHADAPGVVLDLRRNPGGDTFSLGSIVGEFFDRRTDCGTFISRDGGRRRKHSWQLGSTRYQGPVVVLIDGGTGSAAEIFAAVLQDYDRATVIGRRSAGAVLASWFYRLPDRGELQLSRLDYVAPKGRRIEGVGVEPDIVVPRTLADLRSGRDRDLEEALRVLRADAQSASGN